MKSINYILILFLCSLSQIFYGQSHRIYELEKDLLNGDKNALIEISEYFDSNNSLIEYLGHHVIETNEQKVAKRIILENCSFTETEIQINENGMF